MKKLIIAGLLTVMGVVAQTTPQAQPVSSVTPSYFVSVGGEYNHYSSPAQGAATVSLGVGLGSGLYSISTIEMGVSNATVRSGIGYALKNTDTFSLIALMDAGITSGSMPVNGQTAATAPISSSVSLGNVGGGFLVRYDLGNVIKSIAGKGLNVLVGVRMAAVTSQGVQPEALISLSKFFK
jgi:hypothetical protein